MFLPLCESLLKRRGRIPIDVAFLAAVGHRFIAKTKKRKLKMPTHGSEVTRAETRNRIPFFWGGGGTLSVQPYHNIFIFLLQQVTCALRHSNGSCEEFPLDHSMNEGQIEWFKAGSALNKMKMLQKSQ